MKISTVLMIAVCRAMLCLIPFEAVADCPTLGAIRWDAWHGSEHSQIGLAVEKSLNPAEFIDRAPFCATLTKGVLTIHCATAPAMAEEIRQATIAHLDYWAFLVYPQGNAMGLALDQYLAQPQSSVNFSIILTFNALSQPQPIYTAAIKKYVSYMTDKRYQTVLGKRPLVFFLINGGKDNFGKKSGLLSAALHDLRSAAQTNGLARPYIVLLDGNIKEAVALASPAAGLDALSAYAVSKGGKNASYADLTQAARDFWESARATGRQVVPLAMMGWDRRPRVIHPVPWEPQSKRGDEINYFYARPQPEQLAAHVAEAMAWVHDHAHAAKAHTVLIYAWNENDEGGWLVPTLGEGNARVRALGATRERLGDCR